MRSIWFIILLCVMLSPAGAEEGVRTVKPDSTGKLRGVIRFDRELGPGDWLVRAEFRLDSFPPDAELDMTLEMEPANGFKLRWRTFTPSREWRVLTLPVTVSHPGKPVLVIASRAGGFGALQIRNPEILKFKPAPGENLFPDGGFMKGAKGEFPAPWYPQFAPAGEERLTDAAGFGDSGTVLRLSAGPEKGATVSSVRYPFPGSGKIEFSVWAKTPGDSGSAPLTLRLLGDWYQWGLAKTFQAGGGWQKFTVIADRLPETIREEPYFWARIDLGKNASVMIGRVELKFTGLEGAVAAAKQNEIENHSFRSGTYGWQLFSDSATFPGLDRAGQFLEWQPPVWKEDRLILHPHTSLTSSTFASVPEREYTVLLRLKNFVPGRTARPRAYLLDGSWQTFFSDFELTDEFRDYTFSGKLPPSFYNLSYLRIDSREAPLVIDRVRVVAGKAGDFGDENNPELDFLGRNIVAEADRNAEVAIRLRGVAGARQVKVEVRDFTGKMIRSGTLEFPPDGDQSLPFRLNPEGRRGVFRVTLRCGFLQKEFKYAVLKDLSGLELREIPLAGHLAPLAQIADYDFLDRFLAFRRQPFNRFFLKENIPFRRHPELSEALLQHHPRQIVCLAGFIPGEHQMKSKYAVAAEVTPELAAAYAADLEPVLAGLAGTVQGVELFNEPYLWRFRDGPQKDHPNMPPAKVARYHRIAREAIDRKQLPLQLIGPVSQGKYGFDFLDAGGLEAIDGYSFHGYGESADIMDTWNQIAGCRKYLERKGKALPILNTEQYYGVRRHFVTNQDNEAQRGYFSDSEPEHAAKVAAELIHHAAGGSAMAFFEYRFLWSGIRGDETVVLDALGTVNAAIEMLSNAGRGEPFPLGGAMKCFLFPDADGGPLAALYALDAGAQGELALPAGLAAYDANGNRLDGERIPVGNAPHYLRLPAGADPRAVLAGLEFLNLGEPFRVDAAISGRNEVTVAIGNRTNRNETLFVTLAGEEREISLAPAERREIRFRVREEFAPQEEHTLRIGVKSRHGRDTLEKKTSVIYAARGGGAANGREYVLRNRSTPFSLSESWKGPEDLGAVFSCYWNEKGLGFAVTVTDDRFVFPESAPGGWQQDSLQVYFSLPRGDCSYIIGLLHGKTPFAYLDRGTAGRFIGEANATIGMDAAVTVSIVPASNRIRYDLFFPAETLPGLRLESGQGGNFALLVNDNDGKGRKTGLTLTPPGTEPFQNQKLYPRLILTE